MSIIDRKQYLSRSPINQYPKRYHVPVGANSMDGAGFRDRLFLAWSLWQARKGRRLTQAELGELLGQVGGEPVAQNTVSGWFRSAMPDVHDIEHLAKALDVDPGWLAFGPASKAPGPDDPAEPDPMPRPRR